MESYFSFSEPLSSGIDFYKTDDGAAIIIAESQLSANSAITISITRIRFIESTPSANTIVTTNAVKEAHASANISSLLDVTLNAAFERQDALVNITILSNVITNITKEAYIVSNISANSNTVVNITKQIFIISNVSISTNVVTNSIKLAHAISNISISSNTVTDITKIIHIASSISSLMDVTLLAVFERQDGSVTISNEVFVSANLTKFAFAQSSITNQSNVSAVGTKIAIANSNVSGDVTLANTSILKEAYAASAVSSQSNAVIAIKKFAFASASVSSSVMLTTAGKIFLATIKINILNNTNIVVKPIRFSANVVSDNTLIRNLLLLDNKSLTNQTRTFAINATPKFIENENWQGNVSRYYKNTAASKGAKRTFNLDWSFIPNESSFTVDLRESRNFLKEIAQDSDVHSLTIINQDVNGITPYTEDDIDVFITSYSENLIRRDLSSESYYFSCNMVLEEA